VRAFSIVRRTLVARSRFGVRHTPTPVGLEPQRFDDTLLGRYDIREDLKVSLETHQSELEINDPTL
jgi:hypothetical protein